MTQKIILNQYVVAAESSIWADGYRLDNPTRHAVIWTCTLTRFPNGNFTIRWTHRRAR